ncbi:winged helix-turn-helix domain-containing protein [Halobacteria archaeon HArc-gm2]|nr:winged helix-turn-helix domain-containing protein [Halobacteria archaeon HArc-gm2]
MNRLEEVSLSELVDLKESVDGSVPQERVLAAIGRKQGDTLGRLAERHGVVEKTIRNWLDRFEEHPLEEAPFDAERPGRPTKLSAEDRSQLFDEFRQNPTELGYDQQAWTTDLASHHIRSKYGVEYTTRHINNLFDQAGLSWRTARSRHTDADPEVEEEFQETVQKNDRS